MKPSRFLAYATLAVVIAGGAIWYIVSDYYARQSPEQSASADQVIMYKNPNCQCCTKWATHMEQAGFTVIERATKDMAGLKAKYGVPYNMSSCHTAFVDGYLVEGHVPATDVKRLLKERPEAIGLTVPGMPVGSPGMEVPSGQRESYEVMLLGGDKPSVFANH